MMVEEEDGANEKTRRGQHPTLFLVYSHYVQVPYCH